MDVLVEIHLMFFYASYCWGSTVSFVANSPHRKNRFVIESVVKTKYGAPLQRRVDNGQNNMLMAILDCWRDESKYEQIWPCWD